mgnify:CR=1 FL=1
MKDAGKQGSVEFKVLEGKIKALTDSAGNLHDAISDVSGTVKNAGSDTRGLDRTLRVVTSVSAGFQLAQGSVALFGSENKELTNALIKLNGIMAVTNALQQIQDELLKEVKAVFSKLVLSDEEKNKLVDSLRATEEGKNEFQKMKLKEFQR